MTARLRSTAFWLLPPLFCLWLYWYGLHAWFQQDDFAWLGLRLQVHNWHDFLDAMFAPKAQGSIRPWSERAFFMGFSALFGIEALPFHIWIFLTQFANLALAASITRRLTGLWLAGLLAPVLWTANAGLAVPMSWTSAYNQILCAFFLLLAFHFFLRYAETGRSRYYIAQWVVFLLGFGALELNVVYPGLAAAYALFQSRKLLWKTLPLFPVSALYAILHRLAAPGETSGVYRMHWDASIFATFWQYWQWALAAERLQTVKAVPVWFAPVATGLLTAGVVGFAAWRAWRRDWLGCFFLAWFVGVLAPLLPLRDHLTDYYLAIPVLGLAMLGAWGIAVAFQRSRTVGAIASLLALVYMASALPISRAVARWHFERGRTVQAAVRGVERAHQLHPGKLILLNGVGNELFWAGVYDRPFRLFGAEEVYLTPGSEQSIEQHPELGGVGKYVLASGIAKRALDREEAVVYQVGGPRLKNITSFYREHVASGWKAEQPLFVDVGQKLFADLLGPEWHGLEGSYRWMPQRASLRMGAPRTAGQKLYLMGFCPEAQLAGGPVLMQVTASGNRLQPFEVRQVGQFDQALDLPPSLAGREEMELVVEVNRTFSSPGDPRQLGMAFGTFAIR